MPDAALPGYIAFGNPNSFVRRLAMGGKVESRPTPIHLVEDPILDLPDVAVEILGDCKLARHGLTAKEPGLCAGVWVGRRKGSNFGADSHLG
jgi:hypothetical protein